MTLFFAILVGITIGLVLGLTGAGGSVFAVPLLMLLLDLSAQQAIGISLGAVCISALFGSFRHLKSKQIQWMPAIVYASLGGIVAPLGGWLSQQIDENTLLLGFSILVILIALRMWQQAIRKPEETAVVRATNIESTEVHQATCQINYGRPFRIGLSCILGVGGGAIATGLLSGLFGVGGGFLIIPTLIFLTGINMKQAVATSLVVISIISFSGFCSFLLNGNDINTSTLSYVALGGIAGMALGIKASRKMAGPKLQKIFSILMLLMALIIVVQQTN